MKRVAATVVIFSACGAPPLPPPAPPENHPALAELRCKTAVEHAGEVARLRPNDVTMAIGECEQQEWSRPARECVNGIKAEADLVACAQQHDLDKHGIFAGRTSFDQAMTALEAFKDQMCACKDNACAQHVSDDMAKWSEEMAKDESESPRLTDDDAKRATALGEAMSKCMQAAMTPPGSP